MPDTRQDDARTVTVKFVFKGGQMKYTPMWRRQLPDAAPIAGRCRFAFDPDLRVYDWLVVYDDLPPTGNDGALSRYRTEDLACPREHTILVTAEPSTIKVYGNRFLSQFGAIHTSQEPWVIRHGRAIYSQPALRWFYGIRQDRERSIAMHYDDLVSARPRDKCRSISTVTSAKQMTHTLHGDRYRFVSRLKARLPELEIFGHGVSPVLDKAEALDDFRYHLAIENHVCRHHWTEKLADAFLGFTLPFYYGCPNAADYFPSESFIPVDITDVEGTLATIRQAMDNDEYGKRLPYILEARKRVLKKYNIFSVLEEEIMCLDDPARHARPGERILSRHAFNRNFRNGINYLFEKTYVRSRHRLHGD
jgi:hypothetical protein